jgi:hypothetical protein
MSLKEGAFNYNSVQEHFTMKNGKQVGHSTHVTIKGGKGVKKCVEYAPSGKRKVITKNLTRKEVNAIREKQYLPALFKDAMEAMRLGRPLEKIKGRWITAKKRK